MDKHALPVAQMCYNVLAKGSALVETSLPRPVLCVGGVAADRGGFFLRTFDEDVQSQTAFRGTPQQGRGKKASVGFCWGFFTVVCLTFGMASFLMLSAWGRFSGMAWGNVENENVVASEGFITVEISEAEREASRQQTVSADSESKKEPEVASLPLSMLGARENFGPLPKYLSDYESIVLNVQDDGTQIPEVDEGEDLSCPLSCLV